MKRASIVDPGVKFSHFQWIAVCAEANDDKDSYYELLNDDHDGDDEDADDDADDDDDDGVTSAEHISLFIKSFALSEVSTSVGKSKQFWKRGE